LLVSRVLSYKGRTECRKGRLQSAKACALESLTIAREMADPFATIWALECCAELALAKHAPRQAAAIWGAVAHLSDETGILAPPREKTALADARVTLGADAFDLAWREGRAMELAEAVRYALNDRAADGT